MTWKKLGKVLLFPHIAIMIILLPIATVLLVYSMVFLGTESVIAIASYVLAAYTLTVWCFRIPYLVRFFKSFKEENRYAQRWLRDERLRVNVSLYGSLLWNTAYALLQLGIAFWHGSFWFGSLACYYICLAVMRFFLARHSVKYKPGEKMYDELLKYRACGWVFFGMNLVLTLMAFFMVYFNRTFDHNEITAIAMAAYTFTAFTTAIVSVVKYRKYNSPIYSASKAISLAAACVSMLTLESTMLNTFGADTTDDFRQLMLALTGAAVVLFILIMAIAMIVTSTKQLHIIRSKESNGTE